MSSRLFVDAGATWVRLRLAEDGRSPRAASLPSAPLLGIAASLRRQLAAWRRPRVDELVVGAKGAWAKPARAALASSLRPLARRVTAMSDAELLWLACFHENAGVLLIAGTGSAAVAGARPGALSRAGGYGPLLGDEGSAFWIGREALKRLPADFPSGLALKLAPLWQTAPVEAVRKTAALSRRALALSGRRPAAREIRREAASSLALLAGQAARAAGLSGPVALAYHGGLFADPGLTREFLAALDARFRAAPAPADPLAALVARARLKD